ncbi:MAG: type II toxin-antitoxin system RelE/ParE family toxin [Bacteriovoracales bacterium]|nr:type II toxin-antitoxin system RelE/ParE family toxin [Bacteriovoracales bacterium]
MAYFYRNEKGEEPAKKWLHSLKDKLGLAKILTRIRRAEKGNFGDHKKLSGGVHEFKIVHGPGYRVYYGIDDRENLIVLLIVGSKSTQNKDIEKAKLYWSDYKKRRL